MLSDAIQVALIAVAGGLSTEGVRWLFSRGKSRADAASSISEAASRLIAPLNERIDELEKKLAESEKARKTESQERLERIDALMREVSTLRQLTCEVALHCPYVNRGRTEGD